MYNLFLSKSAENFQIQIMHGDRQKSFTVFIFINVVQSAYRNETTIHESKANTHSCDHGHCLHGYSGMWTPTEQFQGMLSSPQTSLTFSLTAIS